jgi:hypothetical protein
MVPHHHAALESQDEMLSDSSDVLEDAGVDGAGNSGHRSARMPALCLDTLADEQLQASRDPMKAVALGHLPLSRRASTTARGRR